MSHLSGADRRATLDRSSERLRSPVHNEEAADTMFRPVLRCAVSAAVLLTVPASAFAGPKGESTRKATVTTGVVQDMTGAEMGDDGHHHIDETRVGTLDGKRYYYVAKASKLSYQKATYSLTKGSVFTLTCFGSGSGVAKYPSLALKMGKVTMASKSGKPGGVMTNEGLYDPYGYRDITFTVSRTVKGGNPTLQEVLDGSPYLFNLGTSKVRKTKGSAFINVTPYVGKRIGTCRQSKGYTGISKSMKNGYLVGTAKYTGYAPHSVR